MSGPSVRLRAAHESNVVGELGGGAAPLPPKI
jgi:hypothetical protein